MMAKMEAQQAAMRSKEQGEEQEKKRESRREEKANKAAAAPQRKSTRASAVSSESSRNPLRQKDSTPKKATRYVGKKNNGLKIADYFKKDELKAKTGKESVVE